MKQLVLAMLLLSTISAPLSPEKLLDRKMPAVNGQTIQGTPIDSAYFEGKVTLINFMLLGCPYCMAELKTLAQLQMNLKGQSDFQILCIAPHTAAQLLEFNSSNPSGMASIRRYYKLDSITYEILPECAQERSGKKTNGDVIVRPECKVISRPFKVDGYPLTLLVDRQSVIRTVYNGYNPADTSMPGKMQAQIEHLLAQTQ